MKKNIFIFLLGGIIFASIAVVATTTLTADQINYDENTTVKDKIDDLYAKQAKYDPFTIEFWTSTANNTTASNGRLVSTRGTLIDYKYFKISSVTDRNNTCASCQIRGWSITQNKWIDLSINTQYNNHSTTDGYNFNTVVLIPKSATSNVECVCTTNVMYYN